MWDDGLRSPFRKFVLGNGESGHNLGRGRKFAQLLLVGEVECKIVDFEL